MKTSSRWEKRQEIFNAALLLPAGERMAFAREEAGDDASLSAELESLLRSYDEDASFLKEPVEGVDEARRVLREIGPLDSGSPGSSQTAGNAAHRRALPAGIGHYQILRLVGEGGMGLVYEAQQAQPRRIVAVKVIKSAWTDPEVVRRFRHESQALARLQHPGIAQIYEAGEENSPETGALLFFAMEFIHGEPLVKYATTHHLSARERLELMAKVCDAMEHAHERGLIHRDLKPGNILVTEAGQPKVLDFGVARVTGADVEATQRTEAGKLLGTIAYMSPEQVLGDSLALDKRSDVYALGVILYELLAERLPYRISPNMHEALRAVQQDDPEPLSSIQRSYRGDVETIVAKALEKDKARRYTSAAELAADIRRHLQNEPITARPPSTLYQLEKFARRHTAVVAAVAAVFLALLAGVIVSTSQAMRARQAERAALNEAAKARAVRDFLEKDLLQQASSKFQAGPIVKPDPDIKVRTALDRAAARVDGKFGRQPDLEAEIRTTIGETYWDLGIYAKGEEQQGQALSLYRRTLGTEDTRTIAAMNALVVTLAIQGKFSQAQQLADEAVQAARRVYGPNDVVTASAMNNLAKVYLGEGKWAEAEGLEDHALQIRRRVLGPEAPDTLGVMNNLGALYIQLGKYAQAETMYKQLIEVERRVLGPEHPRTLESIFNLGCVYLSRGQAEEAEPLYLNLVETERRALGPEHSDTLRSMGNLAANYDSEGKFSQAETLYRQVIEIQKRTLGPQSVDTLRSMCNLTIVLNEEGKYAQAETFGRQTLEGQEHAMGLANPATLITLGGLADAYTYQKKFPQAEALYDRVDQKTLQAMSAVNRQGILLGKAEMYLRQGSYGKAEPLAKESVAAFRKIGDSKDTASIGAVSILALAYMGEGKFTEAETLAREALNFSRKERPDGWAMAREETIVGESLAGQKKYAEAESLLLAGYKGMVVNKQQVGAPENDHIALAAQWITQLYKDWHKPEKLAAWKRDLATA